MSTLDLSANSRRPSLVTWLQRCQWPTVHFWLSIGIGLAMLSAVLLPLNVLSTQRFHHDEALYATWALKIASGDNPLLAHTPIDKPPLFLYTVAGSMWLLGTTETAARLPSLLATCLTVGLTFCIGRKLYGDGIGLLAAWLVALSPFTILFAPTALTDPMLVTIVLAGCLTAAYRRAAWAGVFMGLAIATKQQGLFFIPLAMALLIVEVKGHESPITSHPSRSTFYVLRFLLAMLVMLLPVFLWDFAREQFPSFWQLSLINYGGLNTATGNFGERWWEFIKLLEYGTASPILNTIFIVGWPLVLAHGTYQIINNKSQTLTANQPTDQPSGHPTSQPSTHLQPQIDWLFTLFILAFLLAHIVLSFQVWDRYLLGLIPILALLLARILLLPWLILKRHWLKHQAKILPVVGLMTGLLLVYLLVLTLACPVQDAANARYPLGSHSHALSGIEEIVAYLQGHTNADTTLYHHWLGTHWRFYLWSYPYDLQYWSSPRKLVNRAKPGHLIAFPFWQSETPARLALTEAGLSLRELTRAYTPAGHPSIVLYQIVVGEN